MINLATLEAYAPIPYGFNREGGTPDRKPPGAKGRGSNQRMAAAGWSLGKITRELTRHCVPTKKGGAWYPGTVKYLLDNNLYVGAA